MAAADVEDELCCCEYARDGDGRTRHLLQCFCECEDLDRLADEYCNACLARCCGCCTCCDDEEFPAKKRAMDVAGRRQTLRRVFATIDDRCRVPWFGGARRVDAGLVAAPAVLKFVEFLCSLCTWTPWVVVCLLVTAAHLLWLHVTCLGIRWRTSYFISWILFSVAGLYAEYLRFVLSLQGWPACFAMHALLAVTLASFASSVLLTPARDTGSTAGTLADEVPSPSRHYPCKVCGFQVHRRDHHCVWINQCVGSHNHRSFVLFVASFGALCFWYSCLAASAAARAADPEGGLSAYAAELARKRKLPREVVGALYAAGGAAFTAALLFGQASNIRLGLTTHERKSLAKDGRTWVRRHRYDHGGALANVAAWMRGRAYDRGAAAA